MVDLFLMTMDLLLLPDESIMDRLLSVFMFLWVRVEVVYSSLIAIVACLLVCSKNWYVVLLLFVGRRRRC